MQPRGHNVMKKTFQTLTQPNSDIIMDRSKTADAAAVAMEEWQGPSGGD
jgi:hypothetical protein